MLSLLISQVDSQTTSESRHFFLEKLVSLSNHLMNFVYTIWNTEQGRAVETSPTHTDVVKGVQNVCGMGCMNEH